MGCAGRGVHKKLFCQVLPVRLPQDPVNVIRDSVASVDVH